MFFICVIMAVIAAVIGGLYGFDYWVITDKTTYAIGFLILQFFFCCLTYNYFERRSIGPGLSFLEMFIGIYMIAMFLIALAHRWFPQIAASIGAVVELAIICLAIYLRVIFRRESKQLTPASGI